MPQKKAEEPEHSKWGDATRTIVIALFAGVIPTVILSLVTITAASRAKEEDWARQDVVAERAAKAVAAVAAAAKDTSAKLDVIHTLVNSAMTASMQSDHDANAALLVELRKNHGSPSVIAGVEAKVAVLRAALDERKKQQQTDAKGK